MYGQTDDIVKLSQQLRQTLDVLLEVATGAKSQKDVQEWLEKEYPEECTDQPPTPLPKKKW